jgi:hypothetical protein
MAKKRSFLTGNEHLMNAFWLCLSLKKVDTFGD